MSFLQQTVLRTNHHLRLFSQRCYVHPVMTQRNHMSAMALELPLSTTSASSLSLFPVRLSSFQEMVWDWAVWLGKRTFQPSIMRKKRKTGFLVRQRTVGGRRVLNRRQAKGRMRLGGGI